MKTELNSIINIFVATILITLLPLISNSQTFEWINSQPIDYPYNPDMLNYVVTSDDNSDVIYAGMDIFHQYSGGMYGKLFLKKYSTESEKIFVKQITGNGLVDHLVAKNGKYYLSGEFKDSLYFEGHPWLITSSSNEEYFLAIFNEEGITESVFNLSEEFPSLSLIGHFTIDNENLLLLPIMMNSNSEIVKMDILGNVVQTIEQNNVSLINNIDLDPSGNIIVSGAFANTQSYFGGELLEVSTQDNMYVAKYNSLGQVQWVRFIEDVMYTSQNQVKCDHDGNIYFSGALATNIQFGNFQANGPDWVYDFFLTKLDVEGEFLWLVEIPEDNYLGDAFIGKLNFLEVDAYNNVYVSGFIRGTIDWGNGVVSTGVDYRDLLLLNFSPEGIIQWSKSGGSESLVKSVDLSVDVSGNCYMAAIGGGEMAFDTITHYQEGWVYPFLIKLNNDIFSGFDNPIANDNTFKVYPNPATNQINIILDEEAKEGFTLNLFNLKGEKLVSRSYPSETKEIHLNLPSAKGLLFIELFFNSGKVQRHKIMSK